MAAPDSTLIDQQNDADIPTPANLSAPKANAASFRGVNRRITAWVKTTITNASIFLRLSDGKGSTSDTDTVYRTGKIIIGRAQEDGTGSALQATSFSTDSVTAKTATVSALNGLLLSRDFGIGPNGAAPVRYLKFAQMQASNGGLRDVLRVQVAAGLFSGTTRGLLDLTFGNRDGLSCQYVAQGDTAGCGVVAYVNTGVVTLYLKLPNDFRAGCVTVTMNVQATVYPNLPEEVPTGTIGFDSTNSVSYPPLQYVSSSLTYLSGYTRTGSGNTGFRLTGYRSGGSQTLNTNGYLELKLDDGNILKVAVLN